MIGPNDAWDDATQVAEQVRHPFAPTLRRPEPFDPNRTVLLTCGDGGVRGATAWLPSLRWMDGGRRREGQLAGRPATNPCLPPGVGPHAWETWTPLSWRAAHLAVGRWLPPHFWDAEGGPRATRPHVGGEVRGCGGKAEPCRSRRHGSRGQARARTCPPARGNLDAHVSSSCSFYVEPQQHSMFPAFGLRSLPFLRLTT